MFPNGIVISADGRTLVVAESFRFRLTAFDIGADGRLGNPRFFAQFDDPERDLADGLCIDAEDGVWVGCPVAGEFRRVVEGGEITDRVPTAPEANSGRPPQSAVQMGTRCTWRDGHHIGRPSRRVVGNWRHRFRRGSGSRAGLTAQTSTRMRSSPNST